MNNEMGGELRGREEAHVGIWRENLRERDHLEDLRVDGRIILECVFQKGNEGLDWTDFAQDRDGWHVNKPSVP
jgi:hypothetical protein